MEIAYTQILLFFLQCFIIGVLLLSLFRLRGIFGLGLLFITLGVFQFIQVFLTSSFYIEIYPGILFSSGSMVLFTGGLFAVLLIYIRDDALEARKLIYALIGANVVLGLLLVIFSYAINQNQINNVYNLSPEFFYQNARVLVIGTLTFLFDAFVLIFLYEFISKYIKLLFLRILFTMTIVLSLDSLFFALGVFYGKLEFQNILISGLISKNLATVIYSGLFTLYLLYFDVKSIKSEAEADTFKDIFHTLTFRQKYEDVFTEMKNQSYELQETQEIAQIGSFKLDINSRNFTSSPIFDSIVGFTKNNSKSHQHYRSIVHPEDLLINDQAFAESVKMQKPYERKYRINNNETRELKWISEIGRIIYKNGKPYQFNGTIQDISEEMFASQELKKQNEELSLLSNQISEKNRLLQESQMKFKNLFDKNPVSLWEEDFSEVRKMLNKKKIETNDLKKYLDENPDFVIECLSKLKILNVNDISLKLFDVQTKEELIFQLGKYFNEESIEGFKLQLMATAQNKKEYSTETVITRGDGKVINVLINYVNVNDDDGIAIISLVDITELNDAKQEIVESQMLFKNLFDKNPVSLWKEDFSIVKQLIDEKKTQTNDLKKYLDENPDFVYECVSKLEIINVNNITLDLFGVDNVEELISHLTKTFNEKSFKIFKEELLAIADNKKEFSGETEFIRKDGQIITALIKFIIIDDNYEKAIVSIVDITELHDSKEIIIKSEKKFRELYEKSGDAILIIKNGIFIECNQATVNMLEYQSKEEFLNSHPSKLSPIFQHDGQKSFNKAIDMMHLALQQGTHRFEWIHTKKNGENFPVEVLLTTIVNEPNNQIIHTVWRDITDRKAAELELKMSEKELRKSQEMALLGSYNINLSTALITTSSVFDTIVGLSPNDILSFDDLKGIVHPDDLDKNLKMFEDCMKNGKQFEREFRMFSKSTKALKWFHGRGEFTYIDNKPINYRGTLQDITERKLNELAIKLNEEKLIEVQKIANLGTYEIDLKTNVVATSKLYNLILGIKKSPKHNKGWWESITHPDDYERSELLWQECLKTGTIYKDEYRIINDKKEVKWIYDLAEIKLENGTPSKVVGTIQDITLRKMSDEKIKRSDTILSQVNSLVKVVDKNGNITYASPSFKSILGFEPEDMLGQGWWLKTSSNLEMANKLREDVLNVVNNNAPLSEALKNRWIKSKDGELKLFDWVSSKGEDDSLIFIGIDVTEKQERERQFKTLTETAQDAIILVDHDGLIFEWNKSSEETFGYTKNEIVGKTITSLMPKKYRAQYKKGFNKIMKSALKKTYRNNIVEGITKDGKVFPMELSINFWESKNQNVYCYFVRDVTEREREEKIKEVIYNITKNANDSLSLDKFFYFIKTELGKLINTDNFFIALYNEQTDMISTPYMVDELDTGDDFPKGETLTGYVIDSKKALLTNNVVLEKNKGDKTIGIGPESQCWLGVPILSEEKAIGAIVVQSYTDKDAYHDDDVILLELVASNISQVIKHVNDFERINMLNQALIQTPAMVMITNKKGELEYVNPSFTSITGFESETVLGKNPKFLIPEIKMKEFYIKVDETINVGGFWRDEILNVKKDGSKIRVSMSIAPVKDSNGEITHYVIVSEDVTENRKLQRQFINAFIDAQEIEKQSFGEELHDGISQILSAESMYISLLIEQNQDRINGKAKFLNKIRELNANAVNETRSIAHGLMSSQLKQSGLLIAVENICTDFNSSKNIMFSFLNIDVKEKELSEEIKTNLYRVIQELTTNITRYSFAENASVEFSKKNNDKLRLIVEDNGIGMDYDKIKKERKITGLKNVERRIIYLNGSFEVESHPNNGTRWKITVPLQNNL